MNSPLEVDSQILVCWFENSYVCPGCATKWTDEWSCTCNDRCPDCDIESGPVFSIDLSRALRQDDYVGAALAKGLEGYVLGHSAIEVLTVTAEEAKEYAESQLEGR